MAGAPPGADGHGERYALGLLPPPSQAAAQRFDLFRHFMAGRSPPGGAAQGRCRRRKVFDRSPARVRRRFRMAPKPAAGRGVSRLGYIPDEREPKPGRISAYEQSLKNYAEKKSDIVIDPAVGTSFDSRAEAFEFYNLYSWEVGFGIRWGDSRKNTAKTIVMQEIFCNCAGKPEKGNSATLRTGCKAMIRLNRSDDNGWYIREFRSAHNHPLSGTCSDKSSWPSHKHLDPYTKNLVRHLRDNNIDPSRMSSVIASFFGAMENVLFNKRALKSLSESISMECLEDDVCKTLELFDDFGSLRRDDPSFMYLVELDDSNGQFKTFLWTNGRSRIQYAHFGDAITFDTTYRTKLHDMNLGLFVGVNNHYQSVILGGVLMRHKTVESFKWVFREFVTLMGDQCHAMELAIQEVLPETAHRWCKLHVLMRGHEFFGPLCLKNSGFKDDFNKITNSMLTVREFESAWQHLVDKYNLHGDAFLSQIYDSRHKWAKPYLKGIFCAKQTSLRSNETANHMFKSYVPLNISVNMFVRYYNELQSDLNSKESFEETKNWQSRVLSKGVPVEEHAAKIYTRAIFEKFDEIIFQSGSYVVDEKEKGKEYLVRHIRSDRRETWSQVEFEVNIRAEDGAVVCECGLGEHVGMPCCHAVKVMIHLGMQEIPSGNIIKRWTINARDTLPAHLIQYDMDRAAKTSRAFRTALIFETAIRHLDKGKQEQLELRKAKDGSGLAERCSHSDGQGSDVQDMPAVTTDVATSAARKRILETEAPDARRKVLQLTQPEGPW
ncbi:hypothetical protein ACP4OV_012215 [Aristida adscensionis]